MIYRNLLSLCLFFILALPLWSQDDATLIDEREDWNFIIQQYNQTITRKMKFISKMTQDFESRMKIFDDGCARVETRAHELKFLLCNQSTSELFGISLYNKQIIDLKTAFEQKIKRFNYAHTRLNHTYKRLKQQEESLLKLDRNSLNQNIRKQYDECLSVLREQQKLVNAYLVRFDNRTEKVKIIDHMLSNLCSESEKRCEKTMNEVVFQSHEVFFQLLPHAKLLLQLWWIDVNRWVRIQMADNPVFWRNFILLAIILWLPVFLTGRILYKRLLTIIDFPEKYAKSNVFKVGWALLVCAAMCFSTQFMLGEVETAPFYRLGQFLLALSSLILALGIRMDRHALRQCLLLYLPLIAQHIAGVILCTLLVPYQPLIILTPVLNLPVILLTLWLICRTDCPVMDRCFSWLTIFFATACMVLGMAGLAYIAFTIMLFWFVAVAGLQSGIAITRLLRNYTATNDHRKILTCMLLTLLTPIVWLVIIGSMVYWTAGLYNQQDMLRRFLFANLINSKNFVEINLMGILTALVAALILRFIIATVHHMVKIIFAEKAEMGLIPTFTTLGTYMAWGFYLVFVLLLFEVPGSAIMVVLGGMSMGVGFGLKEIIENFISGVILLAGKQLRPGDIIEFNGTWGRVRKVSVRATVVDTDENAVITFPNSQVLSKDFRNWTLNRSLIRREIKLGVAYGSDLPMVTATLKNILEKESSVMKEPKPEILLNDFGSTEMSFTIWFWTSVNNRHAAANNVRMSIDRVFKENGINIAHK